jgi:two-component system, response regulator
MDCKKILLVEDNPDDIELTRMAMDKSHIANEINVAQDGVEAIEYLFGKDGKGGCPEGDLPVLILLDLKLPRIDGLQVLHRIRSERKTKDIPVVVLTSSNEQNDINNSYNLHVNSYIRKPVQFQEFVEAVRQLGLYWLVMNVPPNNTNKL